MKDKRIILPLIILLLLSLFGCGSTKKAGPAKVPHKQKSAMEVFSETYGFDNLDWVSINYRKTKYGSCETIYLTKEKDPELLKKFEHEFMKGSLEAAKNETYVPDNYPYLKLRTGKGYIVGDPYVNGHLVADPMTGISSARLWIKFNKGLQDMVNNMTSGKIKVKDLPMSKPVVRNTSINVRQNFIYAYFDDPEINNFVPYVIGPDGEKTYDGNFKISDIKVNENELIERGRTLGINPSLMRNALETAKKEIRGEKVPILIERLKYEGKNAYVIGLVHSLEDSAGPFHHSYFAIEEGTNKVLAHSTCH